MNFKKIIPYLIAVAIFITASIVYFNPVLKGQQIKQSDITQFKGLSKEIADYRMQKGEEPYWTGAAFSGMPAYQLSAYYPNDFIKEVDSLLRFLPRPADYLFLYFLGFFILLLALKVKWKLAIVGALSFGFSTYLIIIFGAGHNAKAHAIGYMPLVLAGVVLVFQKKYLFGFVLSALAMALEINSNHPQMTYYLLFVILILGIVWLMEAIKEKELKNFVKQASLIIVAFVLAVGVNATRLMAMKEYADQSTRSATELTLNPDGSKKMATTGLSREYITEYSYGIAETFNLFIPRFMGGGTTENLGTDSNFYETLSTLDGIGPTRAAQISSEALSYWGEQTIIEAPAYIGAVVFFLFFLGIFLIKGKLKQWLVAATIFSILLSWGKNFDIITNFFIDYVPLYNKFRAVSSIQVIAEICVPLLGVLALKAVFSETISVEDKKQSLKKALYVLGGVCLFFALFGGSLFAFEGFRDSNYAEIPGLKDALIQDRKTMLVQDSLRSLVLVVLSFGLLWFFIKNKVNQSKVLIVFAVLILFDQVSVNLEYVNKDSFTTARNVDQPFQLQDYDKEILKDQGHYRVGNFADNPMQDGRTSYFHQSIGGYHAAKLRRYQELFDYQIASKGNRQTINMLNTKYFIVPDQNGARIAQQNPDANGNVWFVDQLKVVNSAQEEMNALDSLNTKHAAVIRAEDFKEFSAQFKQDTEIDSLASIQLTNYDVTSLTYKSVASKARFAVFSEVYYKAGWNAYIDGEKVPHYQVNYVLRGLLVPAGAHQIVFKFEPTIIQQGNTITLSSYFLILMIPLGWYFYDRKKKK
ncbi:membrane protein [Polaribacter pacificus]|uniref:Membrane protein n=1 Tax=Polaribacter pacificus TaxID=1775173 RepID=A0A917HTU8_9FLAO|nr:YfhO family protein [Polaribacter pacificus]GGG88924.1 membrane protein [Polaribacter pacificus]